MGTQKDCNHNSLFYQTVLDDLINNNLDFEKATEIWKIGLAAFLCLKKLQMQEKISKYAIQGEIICDENSGA